VWFVDQYKALGSVDTGTGKITIRGQLPPDWSYGPLLADSRLVVALDQTYGRVAVYDTSVDRLDVSSFAFIGSAKAFAIAPDERLWTAGPGGTLLAVDLSTKRLESVDVGATAVNGLWVDSAGRVWYADDARKMLGSWEPATRHLSESLLPRAGNVVSLVTDGAGTLWVATDAGEAIPVRPNGAGTTLRIGGLLRVSVDPSGRAWYFAATTAGSAFAPLSDLAGLQIAPNNLAGPAFDSAGSVWLADASGGAFYIVTNKTAERQ
jgi:streptogramin lyase